MSTPVLKHASPSGAKNSRHFTQFHAIPRRKISAEKLNFNYYFRLSFSQAAQHFLESRHTRHRKPQFWSKSIRIYSMDERGFCVCILNWSAHTSSSRHKCQSRGAACVPTNTIYMRCAREHDAFARAYSAVCVAGAQEARS